MLAIARDSKVITRRFSLTPLTGSRRDAVSKVNVGLSKAKALTNVYVRDMIMRIQNRELRVDSLESESKSLVRARIYDLFDYSKMESPAFRSHPNPLHNRIKQAAFYRALTITRLWLMRNHNLTTCVDNLQALFKTDVVATLRFLEGKNLYGEPVAPFYRALSEDVFGRKQAMTNYFLNNHLKQVSNLLIDSNDVSLIDRVKKTIEQLLNESAEAKQVIAPFIKKIISSFKEKKQGKYVSIGVNGIFSHFLAQFFKKLIFSTTRDVNTIISQKNKVAKLEAKIKKRGDPEQRDRLLKRKEKALKTIQNRKNRLNAVLPELSSLIITSKKDLDSFKTQRKSIFYNKKAEFLAKMELKLIDHVNETLRQKLHDLSEAETSRELLSPIFKPSFPKLIVKTADFEEFVAYFKTKIEYSIRSQLRTLFLSASEEFLTILSRALETVKNDIQHLVKIPTARALTVQIQDSQYNYAPDYHHLTAKLGLCKRETIHFKINDKKRFRTDNNEKEEISRIQELLKHDNVEVKLPTITLDAGRILVSLPFKIKNTSSSKRPYNSQILRNEDISVKVDLGLKHFAVVSVQQEEKPSQSGKDAPIEIARYFIGQSQLFDLVLVDGKFLPQKDNIYAPDGQLVASNEKKPSNVMLKVRRIRTEIKKVQKQMAEYKKAHPRDFRKKYKYYRLRRQYKTLWKRVSHVNATIKNKTSQLILAIASHHRAGHVYFEDLKWTSHGKKSQAGSYLSFMQVHWLHSQVQEQVVQRGRGIEGIDVKRVEAAYTSQRCSECGLIEYKDADGALTYLKEGLTRDEQKKKRLYRTNSRKGKEFKCQNAKMHPSKKVFHVDSDLNAARNVNP